MKDVNEFLAYAMKLEQEASLRFDELADSMATHGNTEVAGFFRKMAEFSRMHLAEAKKRSGYHDLPDMKPEDYQWPDIESPESTAIQAACPMTSIDQALEMALESEKRGFEFYDSIAKGTQDPEIRAMAVEFAQEEGEHVAELERWLVRYKAA